MKLVTAKSVQLMYYEQLQLEKQNWFIKTFLLKINSLVRVSKVCAWKIYFKLLYKFLILRAFMNAQR